ncbi:hypothetical protein VIS19158_01974 [Vibrio scophthalmi LMG 19158]|uniref:Uncharacterized protein n=1 Tax=Vibrio scophthalmi LMG 19158 TaxID=870967 RepID=F9RQF1_9VIBR|nr:hypothetical protein VIS19158_01974 [Vibrio scophthalmi LMG 19158]
MLASVLFSAMDGADENTMRNVSSKLSLAVVIVFIITPQSLLIYFVSYQYSVTFAYAGVDLSCALALLIS